LSIAPEYQASKTSSSATTLTCEPYIKTSEYMKKEIYETVPVTPYYRYLDGVAEYLNPNYLTEG